MYRSLLDGGLERGADATASAVNNRQIQITICGATSVKIARQPMDPRHARGYAGEQSMGFGYSQEKGWILVEGPGGSAGHGVTTPGFDGVAYNAKADELHLIDNKSLKAETARSATAITKNLQKNLDILVNKVEGMKDMPNQPRILQLLKQMRDAVAAGKQLPKNTKLIVTGEGGQVKGVSTSLQKLGVEFREPGTTDLPPASEGAPKTTNTQATSEPAPTAAKEPPITRSKAPSPKTQEPSLTEPPVSTQSKASTQRAKNTDFQTSGRVIYHEGPTRPPAEMHSATPTRAVEIGEGLAQILPEAMSALQDKVIQNAVARRMLSQWSKLEQWRSQFPNDWIVCVVSLEEWEQPDPAGQVARMVNYVEFYHGPTQQAAEAQDSNILRAGVPKGWREVGPFLGWIAPSDLLVEIKKEVESHKGCFIATACFGSTDAPEVIYLRAFRDRVLMLHALGRAFTHAYYAVSPPLATALLSRPRTCFLVRHGLLVPTIL
ncbi:MAG: CFI-box-CTERM domain-containing protein, partial [Kovacikia sp.]